MARGNRRGLRAAVIGGIAALVVAAPAQAQESDPLAPLHFEETVEYTRSQAGATAGFLYANSLQADSNRQAVTGYIGGAPFTGFAFDHDYQKAGDHGNYTISGWADPAGAAPALPFGGSLTLAVDRTRNIGTWSLNGSLGGQPISYTSGPLVIPAGIYQLGGFIPFF